MNKIDKQFIVDKLQTLIEEIEEQIEERIPEEGSNFKRILKPYEMMFYNFYHSLKDEMRTKTKEELLEILNATKYPNTKNCSWGLYDTNKHIKEICTDILSGWKL